MNELTRIKLGRLAVQIARDAEVLAELLQPQAGDLSISQANELVSRIDEAHATICDYLAVEEGHDRGA
jgi:hypothetical protein